jgi:hypothetical protein
VPVATPEAPFPTVVLRHDLPDGTWHVDWLLGQDAAGRDALVAFRASARPDELAPGGAGLRAERLADHRPVYLAYEGPLARAPGTRAPHRDRGVVRRLRAGWIVTWERDPDAWSLAVAWNAATPRGAEREPGSPQRLVLRRGEDDGWLVLAL